MSEQELLMKIANGEIKDKTKVKFDDGVIYEFWEEDNKLHRFSADERKFKESITRLFSDGRLGKMVEIIEEDKEIEEIYHCCMETDNQEIKFCIQNINDLADKINEIIKSINELKKGK